MRLLDTTAPQNWHAAVSAKYTGNNQRQNPIILEWNVIVIRTVRIVVS